jgi:hypothetical protein
MLDCITHSIKEMMARRQRLRWMQGESRRLIQQTLSFAQPALSRGVVALPGEALRWLAGGKGRAKAVREFLLKHPVKDITGAVVHPVHGAQAEFEAPGPTDGGREPDLTVWGLAVSDVGAVATSGRKRDLEYISL